MTTYHVLRFLPQKQNPPRNAWYGLGNPLVVLKPNRNTLSDEEYRRVVELPGYKKLQDMGAIDYIESFTRDEEEVEEPPTTEEVSVVDSNGNFNDLLSLSVTEAKKIIDTETDLERLEVWLKAEQSQDDPRVTAIAAIEKQIAKVKLEVN